MRVFIALSLGFTVFVASIEGAIFSNASPGSAQSKRSKKKNEALETELVLSPSYEKAFEEARQRSTAVLIICFDGWSENSGPWNAVYTSSKLIPLSKQFVTVLALGEESADKSTEQGPVNERFGQWPTAEFQRNMQKVYGAFASDENPLVYPFYMVVDEKSELLASYHKEFTASELEKVLRKTLKNYPSPMERAPYVQCRKSMDDARKALELSDPETGAKLLTPLSELVKNAVLGDEYAELIDKLSGRIDEEVALRKKRFHDGIEFESVLKLDDLLQTCAEMEFGERVSGAIDELLATEAGIPFVEALSNHRDARSKIAEALELITANRGSKARKLLESIVNKYPDGEFTERAASLLEELKKKK